MATRGDAATSGRAGRKLSTDIVANAPETQYDNIGAQYGDIKTLPATEPERPSVLRMLGNVRGKKCLDLACGLGHYTHLLSILGASSVHAYDISLTMISNALATYPPSKHPTLHFAVADCSKPENLPPPFPAYDLIFAGWFFNYAASETQLENMFRVIEQNLAIDGRFVGITTNVRDPWVEEDKRNFYGLEIYVLEKEYVAPDTGLEVGIRAKVSVGGEGGFSFEVYQFRGEVYERCAKRAGLEIRWGEVIVPDDERKTTGFWDQWLERPTFSVLEAVRAQAEV